MKQKIVVIIGSGPAGLACAYELVNQENIKVIIIDKADRPGGAGSSFEWKGHTLDYGPHAFHTRGDEPEHLIRGLFPDKPDSLVSGVKKVSIYLKRKLFKYPLQVGEALIKFNPFLSLKIMAEFFLTSVFHAIVSIPLESFENWGRKRFGSTLYKLSFGDYTEKVWKTAPSKISAKFASEKIQGFSFINLIMKLLRIGGQVTEPYYQTWIYHRKGSGKLYLELAEKIKEKRGSFLLMSKILDIRHNEDSFQSLLYEDSEKKQREIKFDYLVNAIQLPSFVGLMQKSVPFSVKFSSRKLEYISLILVYLEFNVEKISDNHWFYLLESKFVSNRVTEQKNLSAETIESGKTVLSFEITCHMGDEMWRKTDKELTDLVMKDCESIHFLKGKIGSISDSLVKRVPNVYEIYYKGFDQHADKVLGYLCEFKNFLSIGRRGLFLQGDMHQAVEMGICAGRILCSESFLIKDRADFYSKYVKYADIR